MQGIAVATGLRKRFDWTGVAVGGIVGGVGTGVGNLLETSGNPVFGRMAAANGIGSRASDATQTLAGLAGGLAGAGFRSAVAGTDFGDNVLAVLPDVIANTIGNLVADGIAGHEEAKVQRKVIAAMAAPETDAEAKAIDAAIAADPVNSLQWGGTTVSAADAHQMMLDRMRMDQLAASGISKIPAFQKLYADFQTGLTAADAYNTVSNQTILGDNIHRVTSGAYVQGLITDSATGYQGYLYHADNGNRYIFANAGTNDLPGQRMDMMTDWNLGGDQRVDQLTIARNNARQLVRNQVPNLSFAGHSLGGALAIVQGLTVGRPVVTFNSAPFSATMARVYGVSLSQANSLITDYRVANDPLSMAEDNHVLLAAGATAIAGPASIVVPAVRDTINRAWRLTPPPGNHVPLPVGASGFAAHSMVNVLNLMTDRYSWYGRLPGNGR